MRTSLLTLLCGGMLASSVPAFAIEFQEVPQVPQVPVVETKPVVKVDEVVKEVVKPLTMLEQLKYEFKPPTLFLNQLIPTDVTGIGGSLGHAKGLKQLLLGPFIGFGHVNTGHVVDRDDRFAFTGEFIPFFMSHAEKPAEPAQKDENGRRIGRIEQWMAFSKDEVPTFMPTKEAQYKYEEGDLLLSHGAVIAKAGREPAFITCVIGDHKVRVRVASGALAMIANFDGQPIVLNLTDRCCGAVVAWLPSDKDENRRSVGVGEVLELYPRSEKPATVIVSSATLGQEELAFEFNMLLSRCHYLAAMRRFNLDRLLPDAEVGRILKTAAAMAYVTHNKSNN